MKPINKSSLYACVSTIYLFLIHKFEYAIIKDIFKFNITNSAVIYTFFALSYSILLFASLVFMLLEYVVSKKYKLILRNTSRVLFILFIVFAVVYTITLLKTSPDILTFAFLHFLPFCL